MKTSRGFFILLLNVLISTLVTGQSYKICKIVSVKGDTLTGYANFSEDGNIGVLGDPPYILLKKAIDQMKPEKMKIESFKSVISNGKRFDKLSVKHPSAVGKIYTLLPNEIDGIVSLYKYEYLINGMYPKKRYYLLRNGETTDVDKSGFKKDMAYYFREDKELSDMIEKKELTIGDIEIIVEKFNKTVTK